MSVLARTATNTVYGNQMAIFTADGTSHLANLSNVGVTFDADIQEARAALDTFDFNELVRMGVGLTFDRVPETTLPMMALALGSADFIGVIRQSTTGLNITGANKFLITSAKWTTNKGPQSESVQAVLFGPPTLTTPTASAAPTARTNTALLNSAFGKSVGSVLIGTDDHSQRFTNADITVTTNTAEGAEAVNDLYRLPKAISQKVTIDIGAIVEKAAIEFITYAAAMAAVTVSVNCISGGTSVTFGGSFSIQRAEWRAPGNGPQAQAISLINRGAVAVT